MNLRSEWLSVCFLPMNADIVWDMIDDLNDKSVAFSSNNSRTREPAINCYYALRVTQSGHIFKSYLQVSVNPNTLAWLLFSLCMSYMDQYSVLIWVYANVINLFNWISLISW